MRKLVSVIIPAFNAENFIAETLESVLAQTYPELDVLVVDDGSSDGTPECVKQFCRRDNRVRLLRQKNNGVAVARNTAISNSHGEFIAPLDADDIWYPQKIEKQVQCFESNPPDVGVVYCWSAFISKDGELFGPASNARFEGDVFATMIFQNFIGNASVPLIRRACIDRVGGYDSGLRARAAQGCEDWDLTLRLAEFYRYGVVPDFLVGYRQITNSMSDDTESMARSYYLVLGETRRRHPGIPEYIYRWSEGQFCLYLMWKSYVAGNMRATLKWIFKALRADSAAILEPAMRRFLLRSSLRLLLKPVTSALWPSRADYLQWKDKWFGKRTPPPKPADPQQTLVELARKMVTHKPAATNVYEAITMRRHTRIANGWQRPIEPRPQ